MPPAFRADPSARLKLAELTATALDEIAADVAAAAGRAAPVDTGAMRRSVRVESPSEGTRHIGAAVPYSIFVEKGTRRSPAQPFLAPALYRHR